MKRKLAIPTIALTAACGAAGLAYAATAQNSYSVQGSVIPAKKPARGQALPVRTAFNYTVTPPSGKPPVTVKHYTINFYGVRAVNGRYFPTCTNFQKDTSDTLCKTASIVGTGTTVFEAYGFTPSGQAVIASTCKAQTTLYNSYGYKDPTTKRAYPLTIVLNGPSGDCAGKYHIIHARLIPQSKRNGGGTSIDFDIPSNLQQPVPGVFVGPVSNQVTIKNLTRTITVKRRVRRHGRLVSVRQRKRVGYFEKVACSGRTTPITVSFTELNGAIGVGRATTPCG